MPAGPDLASHIVIDLAHQLVLGPASFCRFCSRLQERPDLGWWSDSAPPLQLQQQSNMHLKLSSGQGRSSMRDTRSCQIVTQHRGSAGEEAAAAAAQLCDEVVPCLEVLTIKYNLEISARCRSSATFQFGPASTSTGSQAFVQGPAAASSTSQALVQGTATFVCSLDVNDGVSFVVYGSYADALCTSPMVRVAPLHL